MYSYIEYHTYSYESRYVTSAYLKDRDERPEKRIEVLPGHVTRHRFVVDFTTVTRFSGDHVRAELAAEQMHAEYTVKQNRFYGTQVKKHVWVITT